MTGSHGVQVRRADVDVKPCINFFVEIIAVFIFVSGWKKDNPNGLCFTIKLSDNMVFLESFFPQVHKLRTATINFLFR